MPASLCASAAKTDGNGRYETFKVPYRKWMRVLDALNWIAENAATDLAYRWICGSKMCGTCAVRMNGREVLACWEAVEPETTIEPLRNLPVIRDLVVDRAPFENKVARLEPWIERPDAYPGFPEPLSHKQTKDASKALDCIGRMCRYSACPVIGLGDLTDFARPVRSFSWGKTRSTRATARQRSARSLGAQRLHIQLRVLLQNARQLPPGCSPYRQLGHQDAESESRLAGSARDGSATRAHCARIVAARGRVSSGRVSAAAFRACVRARRPRIVRLLLRGKINPLRKLLGTKTTAAEPGTPSARPRRRHDEDLHIIPAARRAAPAPNLTSRPTASQQRLGLDLLQLESATCTGARELRAIDPAGFYALNVRILALAEREQLPLMTICNTCTLNLLDAHAAFVSDEKLAANGQREAGRGRPRIQRPDQDQPFPVGAL